MVSTSATPRAIWCNRLMPALRGVALCEFTELARHLGDLLEGLSHEEDLLRGVIVDAQLANRVDAKRALLDRRVDRAKQVLDAAVIAGPEDLQLAVLAQQPVLDRIPIEEADGVEELLVLRLHRRVRRLADLDR